jgi:hypothetical protein
VSPLATRRILWLGSLLLLPLPMLQFGAWIPVSRYLLLAGVTAGLILAEGAGTIPNLMLGLMLGHVLVYTALLWLAAWLAARALFALAPRAAGPLSLGLVAAAAIVTLAFEVYVTPFASLSPRANLLHVLE